MEVKRIPIWIEIALNERGEKEQPGSSNNPRILDYLKTVNMGSSPDETPWCSAFVNWVLKSVYLPGTDKPNARSWLEYGKKTEPCIGAIIVFERGDKPWMGHVGFLLDWYNGKFFVLGGNQSDRVGISVYTNKMLDIRYPDTDNLYN